MSQTRSAPKSVLCQAEFTVTPNSSSLWMAEQHLQLADKNIIMRVKLMLTSGMSCGRVRFSWPIVRQCCKTMINYGVYMPYSNLHQRIEAGKMEKQKTDFDQLSAVNNEAKIMQTISQLPSRKGRWFAHLHTTKFGWIKCVCPYSTEISIPFCSVSQICYKLCKRCAPENDYIPINDDDKVWFFSVLH